MGISDITEAIAGVAAELTGMRGAPARAPDSINAYPFAITYCRRGTWRANDATFKTGLLTFVCDIHLGRLPDLGRVLGAHEEYVNEFPNALLADLTLDSAVDTINDIRYELLPLYYAGVETFAYRFEIDIKYESAIT